MRDHPLHDRETATDRVPRWTSRMERLVQARVVTS